MKCADCKFYLKSQSDFDDMDRCTHPLAVRILGGIRTDAETTYYNCKVMLQFECKGHKLFEAQS